MDIYTWADNIEASFFKLAAGGAAKKSINILPDRYILWGTNTYFDLGNINLISSLE